MTACCWQADSQTFFTGSVDKHIYLCDVHGNDLQRWKRAQRIQDMVIAASGTILILACNNCQIHMLRLTDQRDSILHVRPAPVFCALLKLHQLFCCWVFIHLVLRAVWSTTSVCPACSAMDDGGPQTMSMLLLYSVKID